MTKRAWLAAAAAMMAAPAAARDLPVPPDKAWGHAETGLVLPTHLADLPRTGLTDATQDEHDVMAQYGTAAAPVSATIYLFHPALDDVGVWFDRGRATLEGRGLFAHASPATAEPVAFAPAGTGPLTGLRQAYAVLRGPVRSTALAVLPLGGWLVAVRISARALTADALDAVLLRLVAGLRLRATTGPAAVPVAACAAPPAYRAAHANRPSTDNLLRSMIMAGALAKAKAEAAPAAPVRWCRDGPGTVEYGAYRPADGGQGDQGYSLALFDAGRVATVNRSLMSQLGQGPASYDVVVRGVDGEAANYGAFDALPRPEQVFRLVRGGHANASARGNDVRIDAAALRR